MARLIEAAGIPYRDADGLVADFHAATRHSYVSLLARSGVYPKLAQELARHSDIRLTMQTYTHTRLHDLAGAVETLPKLLPTTAGTERESQVLRATGTDSVCAPVCTGFAQTNGSACVRMPEHDATHDTCNGALHCPKSLVVMGVEDACGDMSSADGKLPGLDSNQDKESQNFWG